MRIGIDIGGTFTDCTVVDERTGDASHGKALSSRERPLEGVANVLETLDVDPAAADLIVHGTTIVTNLIVERDGCTVGLLTTRGFRDVLEIQRSYRTALFDLQWQKSQPLVPRELRLEVGERTLADGSIVEQPDETEVLSALDELVGGGVEAIAVCFLNSYRNPANERRVAEWIGRAHPELPVSIASAVDPQIREYERTSTTVANAYAVPPIRAYIAELRDRVRPDVLFMHSGGGVLPAEAVAELPVKLVQSGPAGGVVAARRLAGGLGIENAITFDMGGTSTDISVIVGGELPRAEESEIAAGIPVRAESLEILSIGAGGGSIASCDAGGALEVGPRSAGALPGPACYGRGGVEPTVSDANLVLGVLQPGEFLGGSMELDTAAAHAALATLGERLGVSTQEAATAVHAIVNANMAQLIREATINKGLDPREFALVSFGGAGGQHAYGVAQTVGAREVVFPRHASTFSAFGLSGASLETTRVQSLARGDADITWGEIVDELERLEDLAREELGAPGAVGSRRRALVRYSGQSHELLVDADDCDGTDVLYDRFQAEHQRICGTVLNDPMEVVSVLATVTAPNGAGRTGAPSDGSARERRAGWPRRRHVALLGGEVDVHLGADVDDGELAGPALIVEEDTVIVVPAGATITAVPGEAFRMRLGGE